MPRNSRALLSVEIRTAANRGPPRPLLSWAFRRSELTAMAGSEAGCPASILRVRRKRTRRARPPLSTPEFPDRQDLPVPKNRMGRTRLRRAGCRNPVPKNLVPFRPGIHQDLSSGSPDNSDVLIGNPIRM
jgi:hypothetical protein